MDNNDDEFQQNNQRIDIIDHSLYSEEEQRYSLQYPKATISFLFLFIICIYLKLYTCYYSDIQNENYLYQYLSIILHHQYYRFITRYFIHFGNCHLFLELCVAYRLLYYFENQFGTLITINYINISMIVISIINLFFLLLTKFFLAIFLFKNNYINFNYEGGFTPLLLSLYTFYFIFEKNNNKILSLFRIIIIKGNNSSFLFVFMLYFFTPNNSVFGNLSGILSSYLIYEMRNFILPKIKWVQDFEKSISPKIIFSIYRNLTNDSPIMKKILDEYDIGNLSELENGYKSFNENALQMFELRDMNNNRNIETRVIDEEMNNGIINHNRDIRDQNS